MPLYDPPAVYLEAAIRSVRDQVYGDWQLCLVDDSSRERSHLSRLLAWAQEDPRIELHQRTANGGIAAATNDALALARGTYCVFVDQDDVLARDALLLLTDAILRHPDAALLYGDEDYLDANGARTRPVFKPDWDPEWLRATNYVMHPTVVRTDLLREIGGMRAGIDGVQDWDLLLRVSERIAPQQVVHVPEILYHWRVHGGSTAAGVNQKSGIIAAQRKVLLETLARRHEGADIEATTGGWRVKFALPDPMPLVTAVIPTRDRAELLDKCLRGLRERTAYPSWHAVIVDNGTIDADALALLGSLQHDPRFTVIRDDGTFNYAALCNRGVAAARDGIILLLNNDVEPIAPDWLDELVRHAARPTIGLVGATLYYPDDTLQHAGVVLGLNGVADRPYVGYPRGFRGVDARLGYVHRVSAMVTACAAVRRQCYLEVGGMDEGLPIACNDLDLCLRIGDLGLVNVITPFAELYHHESASRGYHYETPQSVQESADEERFRVKWRGRIERDPMYNPNLAHKGLAFSLADADAAP
jgi:GT2 family glycosyltransferase